MRDNWRVPEVETMNRTFTEGARFFMHRNAQGVKYVAPPKAEYL